MAVLASLHLFYLLPLLGLAVVGQEEVGLLFDVHEPASVAVSVGEEQLAAIASSVVQAESWLRGHVLSRYPSTNITSIVVGKNVLCSSRHEHHWPFILPSVKNLHYSLVRWGLVREIKVSVVFSNDCLDDHSPPPTAFRDDLPQVHLKSLLRFLQIFNATYTIHTRRLAASLPMHSHYHQAALSKLGFSRLQMAFLEERERFTRESRKLVTSFVSSPYPVKQKPSSHHQLQTSSPSPSLSEFAPSPDTPTSPFYFIPSASPMAFPAGPPDTFAYTPGSPPDDVFPYSPSPCPAGLSPSSVAPKAEGLWCVAKPTVPAEALQEAIDYACGRGGADCEQIGPHGDCYYPDNVVAHASYAFNSYWQKAKRSGGSCGFGGTAILIDSDPSFQRCQFELT